MKKPTTLPKLKTKALDLYSELVKLRTAKDEKLFCYTCDSKLELRTSNCQLGHYLPRGAYPGLTFHADNSRLQCYRCNCHLHGNTIEFRERLIKELGTEAVESLESLRHKPVKWSRSDFEMMIDCFKSEIENLKA